MKAYQPRISLFEEGTKIFFLTDLPEGRMTLSIEKEKNAFIKS
jgi:hypothetical protein